MSEEASASESSSSPVLMDIFYEIIQSPINLALIGVIALLVYKILQSHLGSKKVSTFVPEPELPRLRRDFTLQELRPHDGTGTDGRVLVAVNGSVYDVTKGKRFYGPGEKSGSDFLSTHTRRDSCVMIMSVRDGRCSNIRNI